MKTVLCRTASSFGMTLPISQLLQKSFSKQIQTLPVGMLKHNQSKCKKLCTATIGYIHHYTADTKQSGYNIVSFHLRRTDTHKINFCPSIHTTVSWKLKKKILPFGTLGHHLTELLKNLKSLAQTPEYGNNENVTLDKILCCLPSLKH